MLRFYVLIAVCGAAFAALPNKIKCPYGSTGDCLGFAGKRCDTGSTCKPIPFSTGGICCRDRPIVDCPYGKGGDCGGFANWQCQSGYTCKYPTKPFSSLGTCCKDKPVDVCNGRGDDGICGGIGGLVCRPGTTCTDDGLKPFPDKAGTCCIDEIQCPHGESGDKCGGKMGLTCGTGYTCKLPVGVIDGLGKCCRNPPKQGECPPSSGMPGICIFVPGVNCLGDEFCPAGERCCSEGCGRVCKPVKQIPGPYEY